MDNFFFIPGYDSLNYDANRLKNKSIDEMKKWCLENNCMGFNSLGFMKSKILPIDQLHRSSYMRNNNDGIYINIEKYIEQARANKQSDQNETVSISDITTLCQTDTKPDIEESVGIKKILLYNKEYDSLTNIKFDLYIDQVNVNVLLTLAKKYRNCAIYIYDKENPLLTVENYNEMHKYDVITNFKVENGFWVNTDYLQYLSRPANDSILEWILTSRNPFIKTVVNRQISFKSLCINLERRPDRRESMYKQFSKYSGKIEFYKAVDGKQLELTPEIINLFNGNDFNWRCGVIGCALTHYNLWKELLNDEENDAYVIYEDDVTFSDNFDYRFKRMMNQLSLVQWDLCFLGYHVFRHDMNKLNYSDNINNVKECKNIYMGGFFGYIINKSGAKRHLDYISKNGIKHGIDYYIRAYRKELDMVILESDPQIITSILCDRVGIDSDIQTDMDSLINKEADKVKNKITEINNSVSFGAEYLKDFLNVSVHLELDANLFAYDFLKYRICKKYEIDNVVYIGKSENQQLIESMVINLQILEKISDVNQFTKIDLIIFEDSEYFVEVPTANMILVVYCQIDHYNKFVVPNNYKEINYEKYNDGCVALYKHMKTKTKNKKK